MLQYIDMFFFSAMGLVCSAVLVVTLHTKPLWKWELNNLDWVRAWLGMTVLDYYGAAIALSGIAISERGFAHGLVWSLGFCSLGSPACCAYMVYRAIPRVVK
jgi:hypothetical protein